MFSGLDVRKVAQLPSYSFEPPGFTISDETVARADSRRLSGGDLRFAASSLELPAVILGSREARQMRFAVDVPSPPGP
eukprot:8158587-Heterocapsa_arctica.AAC.1